MNKKIKKYMEEIHKTEQKIADLQQYLKGLHAALKQEEDNEMIKSIRGMKLDSHALHDLLNGIQEGTVKFQVSQESEEEGTGSFVFTEKKEEGHPYGEMEKTESESGRSIVRRYGAFFRIHNSLCICGSVGRDGKYRSGTDGDGTE